MHKVKSLKVLLCKLSPDAETLSQTCSIYDPEYCPLKGYDAIVMNVDLNRLDNLENHKMNKHNGATMSHQKADAQTLSQTCSTYDPEQCLDTKSLPPFCVQYKLLEHQHYNMSSFGECKHNTDVYICCILSHGHHLITDSSLMNRRFKFL